MGYMNPTPEELAAEVAAEAEVQRQMHEDYENDRISDMITELESLGYKVTEDCKCDIDVLDPDCRNPLHINPPSWKD